MYLDDTIVYQESHPNTRQSSLQAIFALQAWKIYYKKFSLVANLHFSQVWSIPFSYFKIS